MFETPRIVPHELEHCEAEPPTVTHELNIMEYGDDFDPTSYIRTHAAPKLIDPDHDSK